MFHVKQANIFAFCNQKGGVGKTTSAINIATGIAQLGYDILLIDLDPQGNATSGVGEEKSSSLPTIYQVLLDNCQPEAALRKTKIERLMLIASNPDLSGAEIELVSTFGREFCLKKAIAPLKEKFDFIFIDCPPSLGLLTVNALTASNFIIIPLQCEYYALEGLGQLINIKELVKTNLNPELQLGGVLLTMADFRTKLTEQVISEVRNYFKEKVFETVIPRSVRLGEAPSFGQPGIVYDKYSKGSKSYLEVVREFENRFAKENSDFAQAKGETKT